MSTGADMMATPISSAMRWMVRATHRLYHWMCEGKDLNAMLPYLSAYMGHAQLSDTYYYIHLVPGLMEEMSDFAFSSAEVLLPEVETDE